MIGEDARAIRSQARLDLIARNAAAPLEVQLAQQRRGSIVPLGMGFDEQRLALGRKRNVADSSGVHVDVQGEQGDRFRENRGDVRAEW